MASFIMHLPTPATFTVFKRVSAINCPWALVALRLWTYLTSILDWPSFKTALPRCRWLGLVMSSQRGHALTAVIWRLTNKNAPCSTGGFNRVPYRFASLQRFVAVFFSFSWLSDLHI
jgi:hypothetical protein